MGNVGQHYFQWRYPELGQPWSSVEGSYPIAYASTIDTPGHWETWVMNQTGIPRTKVSNGSEETVPYSWRRTYGDSDAFRLLTDSRRDGVVRRLFSINLDTIGDVQPLSPTYDAANYFNGAVSPDGKQIAAVVDSDSGKDLTLRRLPVGSRPV